MNDLYKSYVEAFRTSVIINPIGEHQFSSPSRSKPGAFYFIHYDGTGLPLCNCEAGRYNHPCAHAAACVAYCHSDIQRLWDHRRIFEANRRALLIRQGKLNPRKIPRIRKAMNEINEKFPVAPQQPACTSCGVALEYSGADLCLPCRRRLSKIWPDDPAFARQLEREDSDERWRLKLGVGE